LAEAALPIRARPESDASAASSATIENLFMTELLLKLVVVKEKPTRHSAIQFNQVQWRASSGGPDRKIRSVAAGRISEAVAAKTAGRTVGDACRVANGGLPMRSD
jgi:hypothetical protein